MATSIHDHPDKKAVVASPEKRPESRDGENQPTTETEDQPVRGKRTLRRIVGGLTVVSVLGVGGYLLVNEQESGTTSSGASGAESGSNSGNSSGGNSSAAENDPLADFPGPVIDTPVRFSPSASDMPHNFTLIPFEGEEQFGKTPTAEDLPTTDMTNVQDILNQSYAFINFGVNNLDDSYFEVGMHPDDIDAGRGEVLMDEVRAARAGDSPDLEAVLVPVLDERLSVNELEPGDTFPVDVYLFSHPDTGRTAVFLSSFEMSLDEQTVTYDGATEDIWVSRIESQTQEQTLVDSTGSVAPIQAS